MGGERSQNPGNRGSDKNHASHSLARVTKIFEPEIHAPFKKDDGHRQSNHRAIKIAEVIHWVESQLLEKMFYGPGQVKAQ